MMPLSAAHIAALTLARAWWDSPAATIGVAGLVLLLVLLICLWRTTPSQRAEIIRALAELFRGFRPGGPPTAQCGPNPESENLSPVTAQHTSENLDEGLVDQDGSSG